MRGTQSFVGVMGAVWRRPGLVGAECGWRWAFWAVVWGGVWLKVGTAALLSWQEQMSEMPFALQHHMFIFGFNRPALPVLLAWVGVLVVWACVSGVGRGMWLPRIDGGLKSRRWTLMVLAVMRVLSWAALLVIWATGLMKTWVVMVQAPASRGEYPSYVPGFALVLFLTLGLFMLWCVTSWVFRIAPVLAMGRNLNAWQSLRATVGIDGELRGKLIEINLVMGIVKVALVVLALVFSACPLPFSSVETQTFLTWWWCGVGVFWVVASDYFHVVRAAAYVRLWRAYEKLPEDVARGGEAAS